MPRAAGHHGGGQNQGRAAESHVLHELKVISCSNSCYWDVRDLVAGNWGEVSEATHALLDHLATARVRVAIPTMGWRGFESKQQNRRSHGAGRTRHTPWPGGRVDLPIALALQC